MLVLLSIFFFFTFLLAHRLHFLASSKWLTYHQTKHRAYLTWNSYSAVRMKTTLTAMLIAKTLDNQWEIWKTNVSSICITFINVYSIGYLKRTNRRDCKDNTQISDCVLFFFYCHRCCLHKTCICLLLWTKFHMKIRFCAGCSMYTKWPTSMSTDDLLFKHSSLIYTIYNFY